MSSFRTPATPTREVQQRTPPRPRPRRWIPFLLVGVVPVALVAGLLYWRGAQRGNPDPGGQILSGLVPVSAALPNDATTVVTHKSDGWWDSCDGIPGTAGWHDIAVEIRFTTGSDSQTVMAHAASELANLGWRSSSPEPGPAGATRWSKQIQGSAGLATVTLTHEESGAWTLLAHTSPAARQVSGC